MNYITRLQAEVAAKDAEIAALRAGLDDFRIFLMTSPKFGNRPAGAPVSIMDCDGMPAPTQEPAERLDWIATGDVVAWLRGIEAAGAQAGEG